MFLNLHSKLMAYVILQCHCQKQFQTTTSSLIVLHRLWYLVSSALEFHLPYF